MNTKIKGYKASYNGICKGHQYEVGKTYNIDNIEICKRGFHFCVEMKDVMKYYDYNEKLVLFEVIGSGEIITKEDKTVCSQIEIVRIVHKEEYTFEFELYEYDQDNNELHYTNLDGYEYWQTFDNNGNVIHFKILDGYEVWKTFDENNKLISYKDSSGYERSY